MKIDQIEIKSHGNLHVDPDSVFVCPECGADSASDFEGEGVEMRESWHEKYVGKSIFNSYYADVFTCHCKNCGCKWEDKRRVHKEKRIEIIAGLVAVAIVILLIIFVCIFAPE